MTVFLVVGVLLAGCNVGHTSARNPVGRVVTAPLPPPVATITSDPPDHAVGVSPVTTVTVTVTKGKLGQVSVTNPQGAPVVGQPEPDGTSWKTTEPLGYGKTYTINASAVGDDDRQVSTTSTFTTIEPRTLAYPSINPLNGETVGVGQPISVYFDEPIADRKAAEDAITVTTSPHVEGAFHWFSRREVHWRPQQFWAPGTHVTVDIHDYGKELGNGVYGQEDRTSHFTIGDAFIARADGATHQMTVEINGRLVRTMSISMGRPSTPSAKGVHVVTDRNATKVMDSTTFGLALDAGGYIAKVQWATRISNSGEFVHAAPWSVAQQGNSNVSHGCINLSPDNAKWFFDNVRKGDVVINTNTGGPDLKSWDGFGDWQVPWAQWVSGNR
ncbi:MAG: L,D-transpeptidase family protein [Pseudonocardiales bacterium]|nr:L,D-transpeptidase family protein [Pseudonocardiales bacterium]MBV9144021.1 L,D-transpeptidase family protein [Pseudonocardiales bacterium]MBW0011208.1 L,D-transpeptidase family protein [Pseudonocardiales bacterium]